jgi:hypothetical protein
MAAFTLKHCSSMGSTTSGWYRTRNSLWAWSHLHSYMKMTLLRPVKCRYSIAWRMCVRIGRRKSFHMPSRSTQVRSTPSSITWCVWRP